MIEIKSRASHGINIAFPFVFKRPRPDLPVIDSGKLKKHSPYIVVFNSVVTIICLIPIGRNETVFDVVGVALFICVASRASLQRKAISPIGVGPYELGVAPAIVWLNYISTGMMFSLVMNRLSELSSNGSAIFAFHVLSGVFSLYAALPIVNYLSFKSLRK